MNRIADHKASIAASFGAAATTYEKGADLQFSVAQRLAARISRLPLPDAPKILEIGCGTGFLTRCLQETFPQASWMITDISPDMTAQCRAALRNTGDMTFCTMDGENPCFAEGRKFDLICSSLTFQWFETLSCSLENLAALLQPGGHLVFSTLAADSFVEWRRAFRNIGANSPVLEPLPADEIFQAMPDGSSTINEERILQPYSNGYAFLKKLRQIGAHIPPQGHRPSSAGVLRRALREFDSNSGRHVTYHVAYGVFTKPSEL